MKLTRVTCCLFVLLLSLVAFAFTTGVPRAHAASGNTFQFKFHGLSATASFDNLSSDGCIDTFVDVDGSQNPAGKQTFITSARTRPCWKPPALLSTLISRSIRSSSRRA